MVRCYHVARQRIDHSDDFSKLDDGEKAALRKLLYNQRARPAPDER